MLEVIQREQQHLSDCEPPEQWVRQSMPIQVRLAPRFKPSFEPFNGPCASADQMLLPVTDVGWGRGRGWSKPTGRCALAQDAQVSLPKFVERARRVSRGPEHDDECNARDVKRQRDRCRSFGQVADVVGGRPCAPEWGGELLREKVGPVPKPISTQSCQRVDDLASRMRS